MDTRTASASSSLYFTRYDASHAQDQCLRLSERYQVWASTEFTFDEDKYRMIIDIHVKNQYTQWCHKNVDPKYG